MQTIYPVTPAPYVEGMLVDEQNKETRKAEVPYLPLQGTFTLADSEAGAATFTVTDVESGQVYSLPVTFSGADETVSTGEIVDAWRTSGKLNDLFSVSAAAAVFSFEARHANREYTLALSTPGAMTSTYDEVQAAGGGNMLFAAFAAQGPGDDTIQAVGAATTLADLYGLLYRTDANHEQSRDAPDAVDSLKRGQTLIALTKGKIMMRVEDAVTPASSVFMRRAGTDGKIGGVRGTAAAVGAETIDISTIASFETSAPADGLARLSVRMPA